MQFCILQKLRFLPTLQFSCPFEMECLQLPRGGQVAKEHVPSQAERKANLAINAYIPLNYDVNINMTSER
jgi:hypothetical protein